MHFTSHEAIDDLTERRFVLDGVPGVLWTPESASPTHPVPLILAGQPGGFGLAATRPLLLRRAQHAAASGIATATLELPGAGDRSPLPDVAHARADLQRSIAAGEPVSDDIVDRLVLPLVDAAVPECRAALDTLLDLPEMNGAAGCSGGVVSISVRLAATDPRIRAAVLFAGSFVPRAILADARRVTIPLHVLLQWDDEHNDRQAALNLFDAFGSAEKALNANMGGHTGVPAYASAAATAFLVRHLRG